MKNCKMYCLCINNKDLKIIQNLDYIPVGLGADKFSNEWLTDKTLDNISHKNSFYGEYTFHYWFWKNLLPKIEENEWIGFCAYRDYWAKEKVEILEKYKFANQERLEDLNQINNLVLKEIPESWHKYDTIIGEPLQLDYPLKMSKILKHGIKSIIRNPNAIFRKGRTTEELIKDLKKINSKPIDKHKNINFQTHMFQESCDIYSLCSDKN